MFRITKEDNNTILALTALSMLTSGVTMCFLAFYTEPVGEISDSVLWFLANCLIYAGSALGIKSYMDTRFLEIKNSIKK